MWDSEKGQDLCTSSEDKVLQVTDVILQGIKKEMDAESENINRSTDVATGSFISVSSHPSHTTTAAVWKILLKEPFK